MFENAYIYIILSVFQLSLGWVYLFMGILIGSAVVPITLCMCWERLTGNGMIAGAVSGTFLALITWLSVAATNEGGLYPGTFFENTGNGIDVLTGLEGCLRFVSLENKRVWLEGKTKCILPEDPVDI